MDPVSAVGEPAVSARDSDSRAHCAFEDFFVAEYAPLVRLAFVLTGDLQEAEDLAQDAFIAARANWQRVGSYENPGAWVRRAVANRSVSRVRRLRAEARALSRLGSASPPTLPEPIADVWSAVRRLPARQAQVVALIFLEDRSVADVAAVLGCGQETVRTHLRRAKQKLAVDLGDESEGEDDD